MAVQGINDERVVSFINSFESDREGEVLCEIAEKARLEEVPIIRRETASFLRTVLLMRKPENILEIGTAVGYSSCFMAKNTSEGTHITTIENYEPRIIKAKENFERMSLTDRITLLSGDAGEILKTLKGEYDFIFLDAAKAQYIVILPELLRLLKPGGVLLTDNVLQEGDVVQSRFAVTRRNRTIYERMREYLYAITHEKVLTTSIIPIGDGVALSVKEEK